MIHDISLQDIAVIRRMIEPFRQAMTTACLDPNFMYDLAEDDTQFYHFQAYENELWGRVLLLDQLLASQTERYI